MHYLASLNISYNHAHVQKKHIGFRSLFDSGVKPPPHSLRLFHFLPQFMVARMGGCKPRRFSSAVAGLLTCSSHRHRLEAKALVFKTDSLEAIMANTSPSASAQTNTDTVNFELRDLGVEAEYSLQRIAALAWMADISLAHVVERNIVAGTVPHFQAVFSQIQASAEILSDNLGFRLRVIQGAISKNHSKESQG
jgi:hypothetical protein